MKPILSNTEMVRAILAGRKTATRRVVKLKYCNTHLTMRTDKYGTRLIELQNEEPGVTTVRNPDGTTRHKLLAAVEKTPPYRPGDILYVRETWNSTRFGNGGKVPFHTKYWYKADEPEDADTGVLRNRWRPSIHMPKEAARLFLRVKAVRVERLQQMGIEEALEEGITPTNRPGGCRCRFAFDGCMEEPCSNRTAYEIERHMEPFCQLWDSTIKPSDRALYGWAANPWVWVIEFERVTKEVAEGGAAQV